MTEDEVQAFWQANPCGNAQVQSLQGDFRAFFTRYDAFRYAKEGHILRELDRIDWAGKQVLEIGLGQGADSEQLIRRGARWSGVDLTDESVRRVEARLRLHDLPFEALKQGSALALPYPDASFDMVFSHGVLHHIPDIERAQAEIARVLRPGGQLVLMVYARWSLNYLVAISIVRRLGLAGLVALGTRPSGIYGEHVDNARRDGLGRYLRMDNFVHRSTDGPHNPFSRVYSTAEVARDFPAFQVESARKAWLYAPPLPVGWLEGLLGRALGWHLWMRLRKRP